MPSIALTEDQARIVSSSSEMRLVATPYYAGRRNGDELPIVAGSLTDDGKAAVTRSGSLTIADVDGSLIPTDYTSTLSPWGAKLYIESLHTLGTQSTRLPIGWFGIERIPNFTTLRELYRNGTWVTRGARIEVKVAGLFDDLRIQRLEAPTQSPAGASTWDEIRRLSGDLAIVESLPDQPIPAGGITHDRDRLEALAVLAGNLGGIPFETHDGAWSVRPRLADLTTTTWDLEYGDAGGALVPSRALSREGFKNVFIVRNESTSDGSAAGDAQIQGVAEITAGPLAVTGPLGRVPEFYNNPLATTRAIALADAITRRDNFLRETSFEVPVECLPNPSIIPGDVVGFDYFDEQLRGEVLKSTITHSGLQKLQLLVRGGSSPWG